MFYQSNLLLLVIMMSDNNCATLTTISVASRRSSEELIFQGQVTVNGSVCNTPQVSSYFCFILVYCREFCYFSTHFEC